MITKSSRRNLHINDNVWQYNVGRQYINIWSPNNKRHNHRISEALGISENAVDEMRRNNSLHITPSQIKEFVLNNL